MPGALMQKGNCVKEATSKIMSPVSTAACFTVTKCTLLFQSYNVPRIPDSQKWRVVEGCCVPGGRKEEVRSGYLMREKWV